MRCEACKQYVPEMMGITNCPNCGAVVEENTIVKESVQTDTKAEKTTGARAGVSSKITESTLTKEQIAKVEKKIRKARRQIWFAVAIVLFATFIAFVIPVGFIPSKRSYKLQGLDSSLTLSQAIGVLPTLLLLLLMGGVVLIFTINFSKYFKLKRDLKEGDILTMKTKVVNVREYKGDDEKIFGVFLDKNDLGLEKLQYLESEFPKLQSGDYIRVSFTQNAKFVLSTEKLNFKEYIRNSSIT